MCKYNDNIKFTKNNANDKVQMKPYGKNVEMFGLNGAHVMLFIVCELLYKTKKIVFT